LSDIIHVFVIPIQVYPLAKCAERTEESPKRTGVKTLIVNVEENPGKKVRRPKGGKLGLEERRG